MKKNKKQILLFEKKYINTNLLKEKIINRFCVIGNTITKSHMKKVSERFIAFVCIITIMFSTVITSFIHEYNITCASEVKDYAEILSIYGIYAKKIDLDNGSHIIDVAVDICLNELDINDYDLSESACVCMDVILVNSNGGECKVGNFGSCGYLGWGVSESFSCVIGYDDSGMTALYRNDNYADEYTYQTDDEPYEVVSESATREGQLANGNTLWDSFTFPFSRVKINMEIVDNNNVTSLKSFYIDLNDVYKSNNMNRGQDYREYSVPGMISEIRYIKTVENSITDIDNGNFKLKLKIPKTSRARWINDGRWTPGIILYNEYGDSYTIYGNTIDLKEDDYRKFDNHYWWHDDIIVDIPDNYLNKLSKYYYKAFVKCGEQTWYGEEYSFKNENADVIETIEMNSKTLSESTSKLFNVAMQITSDEASTIGENWCVGIVLKDPNGNFVSYKTKDLKSNEIYDNINLNISIAGLDKIGKYEYKAFASCNGKIWYGKTYEFYNLFTWNSDKIYTSDIFYKYPKSLSSSINITLSNYQCNTSGIISQARQEYLDSGYFKTSVVVDSIEKASNTSYVLKYLTQALTNYNITEYGYIDSANEALIEKIVKDRLPSDVDVLMDIINGLNDSTTIKNTKNISKIGKAAMSISNTLIECVENNSDSYVTSWDSLEYYYDEVFDILIVNVSGLSSSYIRELKASEELKNIAKGLGDVTKVITFLEGLTSSILLYDYELQVVNEIIETVPSDTSLYNGMQRLKKRLESGFIACYVNDEIVDKIFSKTGDTLIKFVTGCIDDIKKYGKVVTEKAQLTQAIVNGCASLTQIIMKNIFKISTPDDYFEFQLMDCYRNDMYNYLKVTGTKYCDSLVFLSDEIGDYERVFGWYIETSTLAIDKLTNICNHNVNYKPADITSDYYELSYDKFIDGTKSLLYHFKINGAESTFENDNNIKQEILISNKKIEVLNPSNDIEKDKIYLSDNKIRSSLKADKSTITIPNDVTAYIEGNINIENSSILKIDGNLIISGNLSARYSDIEIGENGSLTVMGDVEAYATNIIANSDFEIRGGLRFTRKGSTVSSPEVETIFTVSKKLHIEGNLYSENIITIKENAILYVKGDITTKPIGASVFGVYHCGFEMESNSELYCNNLNLARLYGYTNQSDSYIKANEGTKIYIKGDVLLDQSDYLNKNDATIFLCGDKGIQTINNIDVYNVIVTNKYGIKITSDMKVYGKLSMNENSIDMGENTIKVYSNGSLSEGTFYKNLVFDGVNSIDYSLNCDTLKIIIPEKESIVIEEDIKIVSNGDVVLQSSSGTLINNGLFIIKGDLKQGYRTKISNNSIVNIAGDLSINYEDSKAFISSYTANTEYNDYGKTMIKGNLKTYTCGKYEACLPVTELHLGGDTSGEINISKGTLFLEGNKKQTIKGIKSVYIVEINNSSGVVFDNDISVLKLFNHNQNLFYLKDDGKYSIFVDFDGDGFNDNIDYYPLNPLYHTTCGENHIPGDVVCENIVESTCTQDGSYDEMINCKKCGIELSRVNKNVSSKGHSESEKKQENYYIEGCVEYYDEVIYCIDCNEELSREKKENILSLEDKVELATNIDITTELKEAGIDSTDKIETELIKRLSTEGVFDEKNITIYDAKMYLSQDNGDTWIEATAESFPSEGLVIKIPYPEGTNMSDYNFIVVHMFAHNINGFKAGDIETPQVTKTNDGIEFTVYGLSPIAISWSQIDIETIDADSTVNMGDNYCVYAYIYLMIISLVVILKLIPHKKRNETI